MIDIAFINNAKDRHNLNEDDTVLWEHVQRAVADQRSPLHGLRVEWLVWDDPEVDWDNVRSVVVRACYDYMDKFPLFQDWVHMLSEKRIPCWNDARTLLWNADKRYLQQMRDLHDIPIVPTVFINAGDDNLPDVGSVAAASDEALCAWIDQLMRRQQWRRAVLKPAVANSAAGTVLVDVNKKQDAQSLQHIRSVLLKYGPRCSLLLQQYVESIDTRGETSLLFFLGQHSHTTRKMPPEGDYRVQFGTNKPAEATQQEMQLAEEVIRAAVRCAHGDSAVMTPGSADHPFLYARVDLLDGQLSELELLEPWLYMSVVGEEGCHRFVHALDKKLQLQRRQQQQ